MWLTVGNGRPDDTVEEVLPDLAELDRFAAELGRRIEGDGVKGVAGILALHGRLQRMLDAIPAAHLARARAETLALTRRFETMARLLADLARLKRSLGV